MAYWSNFYNTGTGGTGSGTQWYICAQKSTLSVEAKKTNLVKVTPSTKLLVYNDRLVKYADKVLLDSD